MKFTALGIVVFSFLVFTAANPHKGPQTADEIMKEALQTAAKEKKNVLIMFHASWCGWCHKMENSINDESCKKFFNDNFVIRYMVVDESKDKKELENPGADELRTKYHGDGQGIPFWLIFDKNGNLLADSQLRPESSGLDTKGENVGCPAAANEVEYFIRVLKKTSKLDAMQQAAVEKRFRQNEN